MSDYDSVYLVPKSISEIEHRGDVNLTSEFFGKYPIMSSPMPGISGPDMVIEMSRLNCIGILHKFGYIENRIKAIDKIYKNSCINYGVAIGINDFDQELDYAKYAVDKGAGLILVDVANGYIPQHKAIGETLRKTFPYLSLVSGNVVTYEGAKYLEDCGFNMIRIGISTGSQCTTKDETGISRNQLASLFDCSKVNASLISDGGINNPGKAVKSFSCGADFVMLGGLLARTYSAENYIDELYLVSGASSSLTHARYGKEKKSIEGSTTYIDKEEYKSVESVIDRFLWGIRSACTYLNCEHYSQIQNNSIIVPTNEYPYRY